MSYLDDKYKALIGRNLVSVSVDKDKERLTFLLAPEAEGGVPTSVVYRARGDCCSHTWIEYLETPDDVMGATILSVEDVDMPDRTEKKGAFEYISFYKTRVKTSRGDVDVEYRNSSNGYYGGSLELVED